MFTRSKTNLLKVGSLFIYSTGYKKRERKTFSKFNSSCALVTRRFNLYQQYRHSMAVPSVTNAQGQVSVIQMQWSPEAGAKGTLDQVDHSTY
jgi:ABC-type polar amino acid transport system ATPase subunit